VKWPDDFINKVICGDCMEVMKEIPDGYVSLTLTDPPYGITANEWDTILFNQLNCHSDTPKRHIRINLTTSYR
jgi:DNA modification methylase